MPDVRNHRNYYELLHVSRDAPAEIIRGSYRTLMQSLKCHPDLGGDTATAALINEAYAVLGDPGRRAEYDAELAILEKIAAGPGPAAGDERSAGTRRSGSGPATGDEGSAGTRRGVPDPSRECLFCAAPHRLGSRIDSDARCETCGSPLCRAGHLRFESSGPRAILRIRKRQQVTFYTHWQGPGYAARTEDISMNGLRLVSRAALREGQRIRIASSVLEAVGSVTHCTTRSRGWSTDYVAGISFLTLWIVQTSGGLLSHRA